MERIKSLLASIYEGIGTLTVLLSVWLDPTLHMEKEVHSLMNNVQALLCTHIPLTHTHSLTHSLRTRMRTTIYQFPNRRDLPLYILCIHYCYILDGVIDWALHLVSCNPNILPKKRSQIPSCPFPLLWLHTCISSCHN